MDLIWYGERLCFRDFGHFRVAGPTLVSPQIYPDCKNIHYYCSKISFWGILVRPGDLLGIHGARLFTARDRIPPSAEMLNYRKMHSALLYKREVDSEHFANSARRRGLQFGLGKTQGRRFRARSLSVGNAFRVTMCGRTRIRSSRPLSDL